MSPLNLDDVVAACLHVRQHLPDLVMVDSTSPMAFTSRVDPRLTEVWVDGTLDPTAAAVATMEGLALLCKHRGVPAPPAPGRRRLALVPPLPPEPAPERSRSGTDN